MNKIVTWINVAELEKALKQRRAGLSVNTQGGDEGITGEIVGIEDALAIVKKLSKTVPSRKGAGNLFIHDVTLKQTETVVRLLETNGIPRNADWWPQEEADQFDNAAVESIFHKRAKYHVPPRYSAFRVESSKVC